MGTQFPLFQCKENILRHDPPCTQIIQHCLAQLELEGDHQIMMRSLRNQETMSYSFPFISLHWG